MPPTTVTNVTTQRARKAKPRRDWRPGFLEALASEGTVTAACHNAGISRQTAYRERQGNEDFALAWADVESTVTDKLERKAVVLALDGDTRMLEFLLKARRPEAYRESYRVEHSGSVRTDLRELSSVELESLADRLAEKRTRT